MPQNFQTAGQKDVRALMIHKAIKGKAQRLYVFKEACTIINTSGWENRWYKEDPNDLTAIGNVTIKGTPRGATPPEIQAKFERLLSTIVPHKAQTKILYEDLISDEIPIRERHLDMVPRAITKSVDDDIYTVIKDEADINSVATAAAWDAGSGQNPPDDINNMLQQIAVNDYNTEAAELWLSPKDYRFLKKYLMSNGSNWTAFASNLVVNGKVAEVGGVTIKVSNNVPADEAMMVIPKTSVTCFVLKDLTTAVIEEPGIHTIIRAWEHIVPVVTDPKAVCRLTNTQT